ncbi:hypothetical protein EYF80_063635 [Liparis tanakae]|uniref:Uncharacterized protein n=1 Tax=Liparis tanakae TaxID=230148 RepID=A0A4Z2EBG5_9TELE|nr:hypothetical protein EYF80_063635 [Liparis tanakae]
MSCWPKMKGCPSARHLQYCRTGGRDKGEEVIGVTEASRSVLP